MNARRTILVSLVLLWGLSFVLPNRGAAQPVILVNTPTNGQVFRIGDPVDVTVSATNVFGLLQLNYFLQGVLVASNSAAPYSATLTDLQAGSYTLYVQGIDQVATGRSQDVTFDVNDPPTVTVSVSSNTVFAGGSITISAEAMDDQGITNVTFYAGETVVGSDSEAPYGVSWANLVAGVFEVVAVARDTDGETATSDPVVVTVEPNPVCRILTPVEGAAFLPGTNVTVLIEATNHLGRAIRSVTLLEGANVVGVVTNAPFEVGWSNLMIGSYVLRAEAVDEDENIAVSEEIHVDVVNVLITRPNQGDLFFTNQTIVVEAGGVTEGLTNVVLFAGDTVLLEAQAPPYSVNYVPSAAGTVQIGVAATDTSGVTGTNRISVTVLDAPPSASSGIRTNYGIGLLVQVVSITNPTSLEIAAARVFVRDLPADVVVYNVSGTNNGVPYVQYNQAIPPDTVVSLTLEYYVPNLRPPNPTLEVVLSSVESYYEPGEGDIIGMPSAMAMTNGFDGGIYLEFQAAEGTNRYYVQYAYEMPAQRWLTAQPAVLTRRRNPVLWFDSGPPRTERPPAADQMRFYRVIQVAP